MAIGRLERVPLREVWEHEAAGFTTWLEDHIEVLDEVLDIGLSSVERERAVGAFKVDLVAEDADGGLVVIENQLAASDHDHLGKVLTYLAALDARGAVWIVARPRPEHMAAVRWLNARTATPFWLVQVEAVRIADSDPAPLFTVLAGPSEEIRAAGEIRQELSERHRNRHAFWQRILDHARRADIRLHANISPSRDNWIGAGAGRSGVTYNYVVLRHATRVELYVSGPDPEDNRRIFDALHRRREAIVKAFGGPLEWQALEGRKACRISRTLDLGGWADEARWDEVVPATVEAMTRLPQIVRSRLQAAGPRGAWPRWRRCSRRAEARHSMHPVGEAPLGFAQPRNAVARSP